jgi:hypothetical protein
VSRSDNETIKRSLHRLESLIRAALESDDTREITVHAGYAQSAAIGLKEYLERRLDQGAYDGSRVQAVREGVGALSQAATTAEKIGLGTDPSSMHRRVVDFEADLDTAILRVREALDLSEP